MSLSRALGVTVLGVLALAACGGGPDTDGRAAPGPAPSSAAPSATATATATATQSPSPAGTATAPSPSAPPSSAPGDGPLVVTGYVVFASPTGNILCGIDEGTGTARCDIGERDWDAPPKPPDCELDWGSGLVLDEEGVDFVGAGDAVGEPDRTLEYGESIRSGVIFCTSAETGVTCEHVGTRHGFTLARARYTVF